MRRHMLFRSLAILLVLLPALVGGAGLRAHEGQDGAAEALAFAHRFGGALCLSVSDGAPAEPGAPAHDDRCPCCLGACASAVPALPAASAEAARRRHLVARAAARSARPASIPARRASDPAPRGPPASDR